MAAIRRSVSIAANARNDDQLVTDGVREQLRRAQADGLTSLYATESAAGIRIDMTIGDVLQAANLEPIVKAIAPIPPDDIVGMFAILLGDLVTMSVLNTTAGALTLGYLVEVP